MRIWVCVACADARACARAQAISVATHGGSPGPMSAAVVEVAAILVLGGIAARAVQWAARRTGMAAEAQRRGARVEAAVTEVLADAGTVAAPPTIADEMLTKPPAEPRHDTEEQEEEDAHTPQDAHPTLAAEMQAKQAAAAAAAADFDAQEAAEEAALRDDLPPPSPLHFYFTRPVSSLVWATAFAAASRCVMRATAETFNAGVPWTVLGVPALTLLSAAWRLALIACAAWALVLSNAATLDRAAARHPRHAASYAALRDVLSRAIVIAALLTALSVLNVPLSAVLTFGGVGGVVLGVGAQAAASNALSGAFLMLSHALHEGDQVELVGKGITGVITDFSLTSTTILSKDATCVIMPNAELAKTPLRNFSRARTLAIVGDYPVPIARLGDVPDALRRMEAFLQAHPAVAADVAAGRLRSGVALGELRDGAVTLSARAYVLTPDRSPAELETIRREVLLGLGHVITHGAGIPLALPTLEIVAQRDAPRTVPVAQLSGASAAADVDEHARLATAAERAAAAALLARRRGAHFVAGRPSGGDTSAAEVLADTAARAQEPHEEMAFRWRGGELEEEEPDLGDLH